MNPITYLIHRIKSLFSPSSFIIAGPAVASHPLRHNSSFGSHRLSDEERLMAFSVGLDDEPLWWRGLQELLADAESDQIELVSAATVADKPGLLAHCAGGLDMIRTVRHELERRRQESIRPR